MPTVPTPAVPSDFRPLLAFVRQHRAAIIAQYGALDFCLALINPDRSSGLLTEANALVAVLEPDIQDYAISSAYARLIGDEARKALSAYFTPPALAAATLGAILELVDDATLSVLSPTHRLPTNVFDDLNQIHAFAMFEGLEASLDLSVFEFGLLMKRSSERMCSELR